MKNLAARNEWAVDVEEWIFCRRADEPDGATLDIREQRVLLGFVPGRGLKRNSPSVTDGHQWQLAQDGLDRHDVEYGELPFHNLIS